MKPLLLHKKMMITKMKFKIKVMMIKIKMVATIKRDLRMDMTQDLNYNQEPDKPYNVITPSTTFFVT
jgi:hypothetical protein